MADYDDGKKSIFNAGIAQTERIDSLQRAINAARFNPLQINPETMTYNYEVLINANEGLLNEAWAKLTQEEQTKVLYIRKIIREFVKQYPPIYRNDKGEVDMNKENYDKLLQLLFIYEQANKELLDAHNLNAPNAEEEGYF